MAEPLDPRLEALLRQALHQDAEPLTVRVTPERVLARRAQRRRSDARRGLRLLALAAVLLLPIAAMLALRPSPTPAADPPRMDIPVATVLADGRVLLTGRVPGPAEADAYLYDPGRGDFTRTGPLTDRLIQHTATRLADGRVLIVGGTGRATAEIWDPATGRSTPTATHPLGPRRAHSATLLADGTVLILGGYGPDGTTAVSPTAERFDPRTETFAELPWTADALDLVFQTALPLPDGQVLIAAGRVPGKFWKRGPWPLLLDPGSGSVTEVRPAAGTIMHDGVIGATLLPDGRALVSLQVADGSRLSIVDPERAIMHRLVELPDVQPAPPIALADGSVLMLAPTPTGGPGELRSVLAIREDGSVVELDQVMSRDNQAIAALPDGGALVFGGYPTMADPEDDTDLVMRIPAPSPRA